MRIGEAIALDRDDVDFSGALLTIRGAKFNKSRLVPVHATTRRALQRYADQRDRIHPRPRTTSFFVGEHGSRMVRNTVEQMFVRLSREVGLRGPSDSRGPRVHDIRHRFAVTTMLRWYRAGVDVERHLPELSTFLGHGHPTATYWYLSAVPELMRLVVARLEPRTRRRPSLNPAPNLPRLLEAFFTDRLMRQRRASPHTIAGYRDTFRLLLGFAKERIKKEPSAFGLDDLDAPLIGAFLDHLEKYRGNSARSRNVRLAAIHSFFRYAALHEPGHAALIQRVQGIPSKRYERRLVGFLSRPEIDALLAAPDRTCWTGRRDYVLLLLAVQTGLRVSELIGLRTQDLVLGTGAHVRCEGKGRKERCTPLRKETVSVLRNWLREQPANPVGPLLPNARGGALSRDGVQYVLAKHVAIARQQCPSLRKKRVLLTCSGTRRRWISCSTASTARSSPSGWATSHPRPHRSTSPRISR